MASQEKIGALVASLGLDIKEFEKALKDAKLALADLPKAGEQAANGLTKSMEQAAKKMKSLGKQMATYITAPIVAAAGMGADASKKFEAQMSKMVSIIGISSDQVDAWYSSVLDFATVSGIAPQKLAEGLYFATSAGFRGAEAMDIMQQSAKVAAAAQGELLEVVNLATSAMNAYRTSGMTASEALDVIVNSVRLGKVEFDDLVKSMGVAFPAASKLGVSFDQVGASIAAMTRTGTSAETSAVQLRQILSQMIGPSMQAHKAFDQIGWSAKEMRKQVADQGLLSALETFTNKINTIGSLEIADAIFGNIRALTGVFDIMGDNLEANRAIFEDMTDSTGRAAKAFEVFTDTTMFRWNQAIATSKVALIEFGDAFKETFGDILMAATSKMRQLITWWRSLSAEQQKTRLVLLAVVAALGPFLIMTAKVVGAIASMIKLYRAYTIAVTANTVAVTANNAAMSASPWGAVAMMIGMAGVALTKYIIDMKQAEKLAKNAIELSNSIGGSLLNDINFIAGKSEDLLRVEMALFKMRKDHALSIPNDSPYPVPEAIQTAKVEEYRTQWQRLHDAIKGWSYDELGLVIEDLTEQLAQSQVHLAKLKQEAKDGTVSEEMQKAERVTADLQKALSLVQTEYNAITKEIEKMNAAVSEPDNSFKQLQLTIEKTFKRLENMGEAFDDFNVSAEKLSFINEQISSLLMSGTGLDDEKIIYLQSLQSALEELSSTKILSLEDLESKIAQEFRSISDEGIAFGESFDVVGQQLKYVQGLFSELLRLGLEPTSEQLTFLRDHIDALGAEMSIEESQMAAYLDTVSNLQTAYDGIDASLNMYSSSMDVTKAKMEAVSSLMQTLAKDAITNAVAIDYLKGEYKELSKSVTKATVNMSEILQQSLGNLIVDFVSALSTPLEAGEHMFDRLMTVIGDFLVQMGQALVAAGTAALTFETLMLTPWMAIAAGIGLIAFGSMWKGNVEKGKKGASPAAFANGGIVYGPTVGMVGEYPNAANDPEVISPLSKLKSLMGNVSNSGDGGVVEFIIKDNTLHGILEKRNKRLRLTQ